MNRIDKVVVFRSLKEHHLSQILDIELDGRAGPHHGIRRHEIHL